MIEYRTRHAQVETRWSRHVAFRIFFAVAAFGEVGSAIASALVGDLGNAWAHGVMAAICVQWAVER